MVYSVGEVARRTGVTVRALHHYDEIGLLKPSGRTVAGYRRYDYADLERLQRILAYRELGLSLDKIAAILDDATVDPVDHLRSLHTALTERTDRLHAQLAAVEKTMEAHRMGIRLNPEEMFEVFGDDDPTQHAAEAERRWGDTDSYRESHRRTSGYTKADWLELKAAGEAVESRLASALHAGLPPDSAEAMAAAEAHRAHISRWFYDCDHATHQALANLYVTDERFAAHYERRAAGLAQYVHDAIHANAVRAQG